MYLVLVAIAWVYVVLLMAMTEQSIVAGVMTFLLYCVIPLSIILYLMSTPKRKRRRQAAEKLRSITPASTDINSNLDTNLDSNLDTATNASQNTSSTQEK